MIIENYIYPIHPINRIDRINPISKIYNMEKTILLMKKRVDITLDVDICEVLEQMRSEPEFKPALSQVVNSLLKSHPKIIKRLKKNGKG
jgi:hypothetical protein